MGFALGGIASGLDTASLVNQLMQLESQPQVQLKAKSTEAGNRIAALQSLNTRVSSAADVAKKITKDSAMEATKGSSTDESIKVTTTKDAVPASLSVKVDQLAKAQTSVVTSKDLASLPTPPNMTIKVGEELHTLGPASGSMEDVAKALNAAKDLGLNAVMVRAGAGDTYVLQVTGKTGEANSFSLTATGSDGSEITLADSASSVQKAQDAKITMTDLGQSLTSATNTFTGVMPGVDVTVSKITAADAGPATVGISRDMESATKSAKSLVDAVGVVLSEVSSRTAATKTPTGGVKAGVLGGDSLVRGAATAMTTALSYPIDGRSPAELGITLGRDGTFTFDEAKFTKALNEDPKGTNDFMTKLAARVQSSAEVYSDKSTGLLTTKVQSVQSDQKRIDDQVNQWDTRLESRRANLQRTYSALETAMQKMQGQGSWLTSQLAQLG